MFDALIRLREKIANTKKEKKRYKQKCCELEIVKLIFRILLNYFWLHHEPTVFRIKNSAKIKHQKVALSKGEDSQKQIDTLFWNGYLLSLWGLYRNISSSGHPKIWIFVLKFSNVYADDCSRKGSKRLDREWK